MFKTKLQAFWQSISFSLSLAHNTQAMILNYVWIGFILIAFVVALFRVLGAAMGDYLSPIGLAFDKADLNVFSAMLDSTFKMAETSVSISIYLIGVMTLWLGILKIGEQGGAINLMTRVVKPLFRKLFPEVPSDHPAMGSMMMNISATMLGLENAATPMGLKAMQQLQEINPDKEKASNSQIMYFVMVVTGFMLLPVNIIALRAANGAANPADVFIPLVITTFVAALSGVVIVAAIQRIKLFDKVLLTYLIGLIILFGSILFALMQMDKSSIENISRFAGSFLIILFITSFIALAFIKKVNVFETFIEGAKEGFQSAIKIIPYLVAMLVAIGLFRASGAMDMLMQGIVQILAFMGVDTEFSKALPVAIMKPLSGNGARGLMVEAMQHYGADSFAGRLASIFQGSTDTTFYVLALYFGSINIKNARYALGIGLVADLIGVITAIVLAGIFFAV